MIRLFQILIFGHVHKWKTTDQAKMVKTVLYDMDGRLLPQPVTKDYERHTQQCETCGKVIKRDLI